MEVPLKNGLICKVVRNEQNRFQLWATAEEQGEWVKIGKEYCRFLDVLDELLALDLILEEVESLSEVKAKVAELVENVDEWFRLHDEYVATLN